ncbi:MAG: hypothetical protein DCF28_09735 [Alphaproteobacteria bacterium]|nr:MAG: hypothetical protein DCF28_09735 [Alphaproteobacteria bacterium]PZO39338.1 MAG: hypothetical protein DCE92_04410 [Alphaproteobacteria bacterium]
MSGQLARARSLLSRPGAWIDVQGAGYGIRMGLDRRSRVLLTVEEDALRSLIEAPGLKPRPGGGWVARLKPPTSAGPVPGRPGWFDGTRMVMNPQGRLVEHAVNLGESPIAWLARRRDQSGRPWLTPAEVAAGERLRHDAELAGSGPSVTMRWDGLPRSGAGSAGRAEPGDRAVNASRRVETALQAIGPRLRPFIVRVCLQQTSLQLAEREAGLRRRQGKTVLKQGLQALADHYGIG